MDSLIRQMRQDFNRLMAFSLENGDWTRADANEIGTAVRAVMAQADEAAVKSWAQWLKTEAAKHYGPAPALIPRHAHACTTCRHLTKPGRVETGYCAQRIDLPPAYTEGHPLHQLPTDQGASCAMWRVFE